MKLKGFWGRNFNYLMSVLFLLCFSTVLSQNIADEELQNTSFSDLDAYFKKTYVDTINDIKYARAYLLKAKKESNSLRIGKAYFYFSEIYSHSKTAIEYADSIIISTKNIDDREYPAKGYLQKGIQLYYDGDYQLALTNFIKANDIATVNNNSLQQVTVKHYIGLLKNNNEELDSALKIFQENLVFIETNRIDTLDRKQYLKSIFALADAYNKHNNLDSARVLLKKGIYASTGNKQGFLYSHFLNSYGINSFLRKEYFVAIDSLRKSSGILTNKPRSLCSSYLYQFLSYRALNRSDEGIQYLFKIDSIYSQNPSVVFYAKDAYGCLNRYYREKKDSKKQLAFLNKLVITDSLIVDEFGDLGDDITRSYEIPKLLLEKEQIINDLSRKEKSDKTKILSLIIGVCGLVIFGFYLLRRNYVYKKRYRNLILNKELDKNKKDQNKDTPIIPKELSGDLAEELSKRLEKFESSQKVIKKNYTLNSLAKELKTNSSYLSKYINTYKNSNFSTYINNLKINCIVQKLKDDKKLRSYTIKAIAEECGYNNVQSFTTAFRKKTGILPSYFIKQIEKDIPPQSTDI